MILGQKRCAPHLGAITLPVAASIGPFSNPKCFADPPSLEHGQHTVHRVSRLALSSLAKLPVYSTAGQAPAYDPGAMHLFLPLVFQPSGHCPSKLCTHFGHPLLPAASMCSARISASNLPSERAFCKPTDLRWSSGEGNPLA